MPVLTRFLISNSRIALSWVSNPYRVHQRLLMAYSDEPRLLFRIEQYRQQTQILVQSIKVPHWQTAFDDFKVLLAPPESKDFSLKISVGQFFRFRLLANPTVRKEGKRLGLLKEEEQLAWIERKMQEAGGKLLGCRLQCNGLQRCGKNPYKQESDQTHLSVLYDGVLRVEDVARFSEVVQKGIGPAKGYGFGLLSLAKAVEG